MVTTKAPAVYEEPTKLWNRSYILVLIMSIFSQSASQLVTPFISKYAISLGAPLTIAATISALMSYAALFLRPVSGMCSDRFNRKKIIAVTSIITAACMYLYAVVSNVTALIAVRIAHGVVFSFSGVALTAFNTTYMPKDKIGEGMGWMALSTIVSNAIGPNLGLWLVENVGYGACFTIAAIACVSSTLILLAIPYHPVQGVSVSRRKIGLNSLISMRILPYAVLMGLFSCGNGLVNTFIALLGDVRDLNNIGLFFTAYSITMVAVRPFAGKLLDQKGLKIILYPAYVLAAISMVLLGHASALWMVILAGILKAVGQGSGAPAIQAHCIKLMGREKAGVVSSTCLIWQDLGNALAPTIGALVSERFGYQTMFTGYAALLLVFGCSIFFLKNAYEQKKYGI